MRILIFITLLVGVLYGGTVNSYYKDLYNLNNNQKEVMLRAYIQGAEYDYGYTLTAIAWTESNFGKFKMNVNDGDVYKYKGSYGVYHILLNTVMSREEIKSQWHASRVAERLYTDQKYCGTKALEELLFWDRTWKSKGVEKHYRHVVASYNAGYNSINSKNGRKYSEVIALRVKALKKYFKEHNIDELLK